MVGGPNNTKAPLNVARGFCLGRLGSFVLLIAVIVSWAGHAGAQLREENKQVTPSDVQKPPNNTPTISSLKVRIVTHRDPGAGTDNAVYFDIGPVAWRLNKRFHNDFEAGSDDTYTLTVPKGLTKDDILWLRLHKKGLAGVTGTKDGITGAWHPKSVTLFVNETEFKTVQIYDALNSRCWYWRSPLVADSDLNLLARSLRIKPNERLGFVAKASGFVTIIFKKMGISGWISNPVQKECRDDNQSTQLNSFSSLCVTGEVIRKATSTDGLQTIDMKVAQIQSCDKDNENCNDRILLNPAHRFQLPRYIRVENRHARDRVSIGTVARICGSLKWDTDREGWWEIHPRNTKDLPADSTFKQ